MQVAMTQQDPEVSVLCTAKKKRHFPKRFKATPYCCLMDGLWRANRIYDATLAGTCPHTIRLSNETAGHCHLREGESLFI